MIIKKIKVFLDAVNGLHFPFGEEYASLVKYIKKHEAEEMEITVGSATLLLALDVYCEAKDIKLEAVLPDGNKAKEICEAHRFVSEEYVKLDLFGADCFDEEDLA